MARSKTEEQVLKFGDRLRSKKLDAWHIGMLLAGYNSGITLALFLLSMVTVSVFSLWVYILLGAPILFVIFWFWFTQNILHFYKKMPVYDALMIAKIGAMPFVVTLIFSAIGFSYGLSEVGTTDWKVVLYYIMVFSVGSIFMELTVVVFGLRHRIRIIKVPEGKKVKKKK